MLQPIKKMQNMPAFLWPEGRFISHIETLGGILELSIRKETWAHSQ